MVEFCTPRVSAWQCSAGRRRGDRSGTARRRHNADEATAKQLYCASVSVATAPATCRAAGRRCRQLSDVLALGAGGVDPDWTGRAGVASASDEALQRGGVELVCPGQTRRPASRSGSTRVIITQELRLQSEPQLAPSARGAQLEAAARRFRCGGSVGRVASSAAACYRVGELGLDCLRALALLSISAHPSQIEWENMFRWSIAARMPGEGTSQVSSIRTRPHHAQAGRIWPASNAFHTRENVSIMLSSSFRPVSPARPQGSCRRSSGSFAVLPGRGGGGFRRWRRRRR